jgi:hypothetical protein
MERQMNNAKSARTPTQLELFGDNKSSLLLPQVPVSNQFNNRLMRDKPKTTLVNKYLRHQLLLSSDTTMINLAPIEYVQETCSGTLNATTSKSTTPQTNLGAALAALNHLEDSPAVRRLHANVSVATA